MTERSVTRIQPTHQAIAGLCLKWLMPLFKPKTVDWYPLQCTGKKVIYENQNILRFFIKQPNISLINTPWSAHKTWFRKIDTTEVRVLQMNPSNVKFEDSCLPQLKTKLREQWGWTRRVKLLAWQLNNELNLTVNLCRAQLRIQLILLCRFITVSDSFHTVFPLSLYTLS